MDAKQQTLDWLAMIFGLLFEAWPFVLLLALPLFALAGLQRWLGNRFPGSSGARSVGMLVQYASLVIGLVGNALVLLLCIQFARYIEPGGRGRPMLEGLLFACIALATALVGLPSAVWQLARRGPKAATAVGLVLCLTPFPLGAVLINAIADHYMFFIEP